MRRFLIGLKHGLIAFIFGLVCTIVGVVLVIIGNSNDNETLTIVGGIITFGFAVATIATPVMIAKDKMRSICSNCQESMAVPGTEYSWQTSELSDKYDNQGKFVAVEAVYTCTITCPHCGETNMFDKTIQAKNTAKCNKGVDNYMKSLLRQKK